jgi:hypothetical protein
VKKCCRCRDREAVSMNYCEPCYRAMVVMILRAKRRDRRRRRGHYR